MFYQKKINMKTSKLIRSKLKSPAVGRLSRDTRGAVMLEKATALSLFRRQPVIMHTLDPQERVVLGSDRQVRLPRRVV